MIVATTVLATLAFALGLRVTGMLQVTATATATARGALAALGDAALDDDARERAARAASGQLFKASGSILVRAAACLALAAVPIVVADATGLAAWARVNDFLVSVPGLLTSLAAGTAAFIPLRRS